jgi:hypothetical protein
VCQQAPVLFQKKRAILFESVGFVVSRVSKNDERGRAFVAGRVVCLKSAAAMLLFGARMNASPRAE